jgi:hypothetical protein
LSLHGATVRAARVEEAEHHYLTFNQIGVEAELPSILIAHVEVRNLDLPNACDVHVYHRRGGRFLILTAGQATSEA